MLSKNEPQSHLSRVTTQREFVRFPKICTVASSIYEEQKRVCDFFFEKLFVLEHVLHGL